MDLARRLRGRLELGAPAAWRIPSAETTGARLATIVRELRECRRCPSGGTGGRAVCGTGPPRAQVLFVGERTGFAGDLCGEALPGSPGELFDRILASIGLSRGEVFITGAVRCPPLEASAVAAGPGDDRSPSPEELSACRPHLEAEIRARSPRCIVALGEAAARTLIGGAEPIGRLRGSWREYRDGTFSARLLATYHPAELLLRTELKKEAWQDMKALRAELDRG